MSEYNLVVLSIAIVLGAVTDFYRSVTFGERKSGFTLKSEAYRIFATLVVMFLLLVSTEGIGNIEFYGEHKIGDNMPIWYFIFGGSAKYAIDFAFNMFKNITSKINDIWTKRA